jgi:CO/xanthine dehydrogenase FAD-binding subunit
MSQAFRPSNFHKPRSLDEASELLKKNGERARIIAGGTGVYERAHRGLFSDVETLVDITGLGLDYIRVEEKKKKNGGNHDGGELLLLLRVGACATMSSLSEWLSSNGSARILALSDALKQIQPLQVKNVATIGGAICTALPFFDLPVALIALDAEARVFPQGRVEKILSLIQGYFALNLAPGEIVEEVRIPLGSRERELVGSAFQKFSLTGDDWAIMNCGAAVRLSDDSSEEFSEVALSFGGGVGEKAKRAFQTERALVGVRSDDEPKLQTILDSHLGDDLETITDIRASSAYRLRLSKVLARRTLISAAGRAKSGAGRV